MADQEFAVVEGPGIPESHRTVEPGVEGDALPVGQRGREAVRSQLHPPRARLAVDALHLQQQAGALGRPARRLAGQSSLDPRHAWEFEPADVVGRQR